MEKDVQITVRIPEYLKKAFQEALEKDNRQYSQSQILRHWIERYVTNGEDQGNQKLSDLKDDLQALKAEVDNHLKAKDQIIELLQLMVKASYLPSKENND